MARSKRRPHLNTLRALEEGDAYATNSRRLASGRKQKMLAQILPIHLRRNGLPESLTRHTSLYTGKYPPPCQVLCISRNC